MAADAPSWADQWGAGGIGAMGEAEEDTKAKSESKKKATDGKGGFNKAKAAAMVGAHKIKSGASNSFKWVKNQCRKKNSTTK
ncbi:hypothetical protein Ddye_019694 [Dipteronia dyeriana]|uniref:Uncharacterized protein n=1 Tax=Dipteronia dyeriana TaxID=168575 RepID=A0AAD9TYA2_9ROSI|nr:hypothetical protein Ddye_019694 [Dipteronia dyeriana]